MAGFCRKKANEGSVTGEIRSSVNSKHLHLECGRICIGDACDYFNVWKRDCSMEGEERPRIRLYRWITLGVSYKEN